MRGIQFRGGYHDFTIEKGGLNIYPRLSALFLGKRTERPVTPDVLRAEMRAAHDGVSVRAWPIAVAGPSSSQPASALLTYSSLRATTPSTRTCTRNAEARGAGSGRNPLGDTWPPGRR